LNITDRKDCEVSEQQKIPDYKISRRRSRKPRRAAGARRSHTVVGTPPQGAAHLRGSSGRRPRRQGGYQRAGRRPGIGGPPRPRPCWLPSRRSCRPPCPSSSRAPTAKQQAAACPICDAGTCKLCATVAIVAGVLFLLQDLAIWDFWGISWYTVGFLILGIGSLMGTCKK